jgi:hypothetical protein
MARAEPIWPPIWSSRRALRRARIGLIGAAFLLCEAESSTIT